MNILIIVKETRNAYTVLNLIMQYYINLKPNQKKKTTSCIFASLCHGIEVCKFFIFFPPK